MLTQELTTVLNKYSQENASNTPDFILAAYLIACLAAFNAAVTRRELWYGREPTRLSAINTGFAEPGTTFPDPQP